MCQIHSVLKNAIGCFEDITWYIEMRSADLAYQIGLAISNKFGSYLHTFHHDGFGTIQAVTFREIDQQDRVWANCSVDIQSEITSLL